MAAAIVVLVFVAVSVFVVLFTGRRKSCACNKGYIVVPYRGDMKELEMTVKSYYYEELFESAEYRRKIVVVYKDDEDECLELYDKFGFIDLVSEDCLAQYLRKTEGKDL
ncbi:MAG: hypothetical protein IJ571_08305 [Ruminococcus sp.]|nr:hypothetical protein [Ruminococcus sp.]